MANQYTSKVVLANGTTVMDLTGDTIDKTKLLAPYTAHDKSGAPITGTCTFDSDTSDATMASADLLAGAFGYARGARIDGSLPNIGKQTSTIKDADDSITITYGAHDGSGKVTIDATEVAKLKDHSNIKAGITILGETGEYTGEGVTAEAKTATPNFTTQTIVPTTTDYLSQVTVNPIPVSYVDNSAGGQTCTIG